MSQTPSSGGIFINGKAQVAEMLQYMTSEEKRRILNIIRVRNPALAQEIEEISFTFADIFSLSNDHLQILFKSAQAAILGIALRDLSSEIQRKVLAVAPRAYAEECFKWMTGPLSNEKRDVKRAQEKILAIVSNWPKALKSQLYS